MTTYVTPLCPSCEQERPDAVSPYSFAPGSVCPNCGHVEPRSEDAVGVHVIPARDGEFGVNLFILLDEWAYNGAAVQSRPLSVTEALAVSKQLNESIKQVLRSIVESPGVRSCRCGCDRPWTDPDSDDYLFAHVECDECGGEFPIDESFTERTQEYADGPITTQYYCPECCADADLRRQDMTRPNEDLNAAVVALRKAVGR